MSDSREAARARACNAMDPLSQLIALTPVQGRLDFRCEFGAPWRLEELPAGVREIAFHVLLRGTAIVEGDGAAPEALRAGDVLLFPSGAGHALHDGSGQAARAVQRHRSSVVTIARNDGQGAPAELLCGRFLLPSTSERLLRDFLPRRLVVHSQPGDADANDFAGTRLARLIELIREESTEEGPGSAALIDHLCAALFALTLRFAGESAHPPKGLLAVARKSRLQPAVQAMLDAPQRAWTLADLARLSSMSRATLVRQFQEIVGRPPADLLTEIRMTHARRQLERTDYSIAAIAESVGYLSEAAFQRAFKRDTGMTPARWRAASLTTQ
jgi:AraC family transcriptional activator of mtrCDE